MSPITRWQPQMSVLLGKPGVLPESVIKAHIREHRLPASGRGRTRRVTITPQTLTYFFEPAAALAIAEEYFGLDELPKEGEGLEEIVYSASKEKQFIAADDFNLQHLNTQKGTYVTIDQAVQLLVNYDQDTLRDTVAEAHIELSHMKLEGNKDYILLDEETMGRIPRRDLSEEEKIGEIYTADRRQVIVDKIDTDNVPLGDGVWLLSSQAAKLLDNYTAHYFQRHARDLGIKREKVFGTERYFVDQKAIDKFPKKQLTEEDILLIKKLSNVVHHQAIASAMSCAKGYVAVIASGREEEGRSQLRRADSDDRLEQALELYFDYPEGPTRKVIFENVFGPLATEMGKSSQAEPGAFLTPYLELMRKVRGQTLAETNIIKNNLRDIVECQVLGHLDEYARTYPDMPRLVLDKVHLPMLDQTWTITNYFYLESKKAIRQDFESRIAEAKLKLFGALDRLHDEDVLYLGLRYALDRPAQEVDWRFPSQQVMGHLLGIETPQVSILENRLLDRLRCADYIEPFNRFGYTFFESLTAMRKEYKRPETPLVAEVINGQVVI